MFAAMSAMPPHSNPHLFSPRQFRALAEQANPTLGRVKESSLAPLLALFDAHREGLPLTPPQKQQVQELVFEVPHDKQLRYQTAFQYLTTKVGTRICGRPIKPGMKFEKFQVGHFRYDSSGTIVDMPVGSYHHVFKFSWESSTGNRESLRGVGTREHVKFRTRPSDPPFNFVQASVPMEFHQGTPDGGQFLSCHDDHSTKHPSLICAMPRVPGQLVAEQWYQYTIDNGVTWTNIPGAAYLITKGVRAGRNGLVFFFAKTNWAPHNTKSYHFEVEYEIGAQPSPMPVPGIKLSMQSGTDAALKEHALRIVAAG